MTKSIESHPKKELLNRPIGEFFVNASHNSYLSSTQHLSTVSPSTVINVLNSGARCIELDVKEFMSQPVVAHGNKTFMTTLFVKLSSMLDAIVGNAFRTSDPLFLCLEIIDKNDSNVAKIKALLIEKFGNRLLNSNPKDPKSFTKLPLRSLLNKVILLNTPHKILNDISDNIITYYNIEHTNSSFKREKKEHVVRTYMAEGIQSAFSMNYDPIQQWKKGFNMVALNFQTNDIHLKKNVEFFKDYSFRHMSDPDVIKFLSR